MCAQAQAADSSQYEEQEQVIDKVEVFKIKGRDKRGHKILRIIGKSFPGNLVNNVNVIFLILSIFVCVCVCVFFFNCLFIKCLFWFLFIYRSVCECGNGEEVFGGEGVSEIGEEAIFGGVRAHRSSKEREFSGNLSPTINLRWDSDGGERQSTDCVFCASRPSS